MLFIFYYKYYITLFSIDKKILEEKSKIGNIYSNIFIYNPFLLTCVTIYLIKEKMYLEKFLNLLFFLFQINKGNIPILFKHNILFYLLQIPLVDNKYNYILSNMFYLCFPLL